MARHAPAPFECPECGALVAGVSKHADWHRALAGDVAPGDDYPTAKLPPIRDRILPRPPAPEVRELSGAELLRALADELRAYDDEDQADEDDAK